jgi:hypothetical protein
MIGLNIKTLACPWAPEWNRQQQMDEQKWLQRWHRIVSNLCHPLAPWHDARYDPQSLVCTVNRVFILIRALKKKLPMYHCLRNFGKQPSLLGQSLNEPLLGTPRGGLDFFSTFLSRRPALCSKCNLGFICRDADKMLPCPCLSSFRLRSQEYFC